MACIRQSLQRWKMSLRLLLIAARYAVPSHASVSAGSSCTILAPLFPRSSTVDTPNWIFIRTAQAAVQAGVSHARLRSEKTFEPSWLRADPLVLALGFVGWTVPSSIPVSGFGGNSLFGLLNASIGEELALFPQGPALGDKFWRAT